MRSQRDYPWFIIRTGRDPEARKALLARNRAVDIALNSQSKIEVLSDLLARDGYSTLLAARACGVGILALSATPQLHAPQLLQELRKVFDEVKTFSVEDPGIREHMPERLLVVEQVETPPKLMRVYRALGELIRVYGFRISKMYGPRYPRNCSRHQLCRAQLAVRMLRMRLVEDGASSVQGYGT